MNIPDTIWILDESFFIEPNHLLLFILSCHVLQVFHTYTTPTNTISCLIGHVWMQTHAHLRTNTSLCANSFLHSRHSTLSLNFPCCSCFPHECLPPGGQEAVVSASYNKQVPPWQREISLVILMLPVPLVSPITSHLIHGDLWTLQSSWSQRANNCFSFQHAFHL